MNFLIIVNNNNLFFLFKKKTSTIKKQLFAVNLKKYIKIVDYNKNQQ